MGVDPRRGILATAMFLQACYIACLGLLSASMVGLAHVLAIFLPLWLQVSIGWVLVWILVDLCFVQPTWESRTINDIFISLATVEARLTSMEGAVLGQQEMKRKLSHTTLSDLATGIEHVSTKLDLVGKAVNRKMRKSSSMPT